MNTTYYRIRHSTRFRYSVPITESIMEVRVQPMSEGSQRCLDFHLSTTPRAQIFSYRDELGNRVHHFDIPNQHSSLTISSETIVEMMEMVEIPERLSERSWKELDELVASDEYWDVLQPSHFAHRTDLLEELMGELDIRRRDDVLTVLHDISRGIKETIAYTKNSTRVDSPIDDALRNRQGVCQDFTHIMISMVRELGIPCRYVSGYLCLTGSPRDSARSAATHAWAEALLPGLGWIGFDPTNDVIAREHHVRVAVGRDYADVPPTRGTFRGKAESELSVSVHVQPTDTPPANVDIVADTNWVAATTDTPLGEELEEGQQRQAAQQQ
jgi:transglutaminase-like putative cysteine protease